MKRMIKVLLVAVLMAVILVASISPAMAVRRAGVLLSSPQPCLANTQNPNLVLNPPGRTPGCWFLLPPGAASNPPVTIDSGGVVL
ncbi:MAG TPA: hypothetical protein VN178_12145 [Rubrobacter sp.]|jgi:hypothetical protein|nr:hypothetical protein [Rubrobacter sp.]